MNPRLEKIFARIDALSLRERGLLLGAVLVVMISLWDQLLIVPQDRQRKILSSEIGMVRDRVSRLDDQSQVIVRRLEADPDAATRVRIEQLELESRSIDDAIGVLAGDLIPPKKMARVLEEILLRNTDLTLTRVQSLPPSPLLDTTALTQGNDEVDVQPMAVYRHSMIIEFSGSYLDTLAYLKTLEELPWSFFWDSVDFIVDEYPRARVTIGVSTLSLQEAWIGV